MDINKVIMRHHFVALSPAIRKGDPNIFLSVAKKFLQLIISFSKSFLPPLHALSSTEQFPTDFLPSASREVELIPAANGYRHENSLIKVPAKIK